MKLNAEKYVEPEFIGVFYHRSTLENNKISKCDCVDTKVTQLEGDLFKIEVPFHADKYRKKEIYDLSLEVKDESQYHNIRIGNQRESFNIQNLATRKV